MKSMAALIFEMLQRFANCTRFVRNLSHDSPSSADTATQSQNCQLDTKRFPGMRQVCERYAKGMRKVWPPRPLAGRADLPREGWRHGEKKRKREKEKKRIREKEKKRKSEKEKKRKREKVKKRKREKEEEEEKEKEAFKKISDFL